MAFSRRNFCCAFIAYFLAFVPLDARAACENDQDCTAAAQSWVEQQQQTFMCDQAGAVICIIDGGNGKEGVSAICRGLSSLDNSVSSCVSGGFATCDSDIQNQLDSFKSNWAEMLQPGVTCSVPPPPPPTPPENWCGPGFDGTVCGTTQQQCEQWTKGFPCKQM